MIKPKKNITLTILFLQVFSVGVFAQTADDKKAPDIKYRRSSLHMVLIQSDKFQREETVINAYNTAPFPDKYNNHSIASNLLDPKKYPITDADREAAGMKHGKASKNESSSGNTDISNADYPLIIRKYIKDTKMANQLVAKWFNRKPNGAFDMNLIGERGSYNASEMEANIAKGSARGVSSLSDAGEELIKNTFVVFTKLTFVENEVVAAAAREVAKVAAGRISNAMLQKAALKSADMAYEKAKEGYSVWTTAYLYRLKWNDSISAVFYNDLWVDNSKIDETKKNAFDQTNLFELEFVGDENATSLVTFSLKEKRTEEQIVATATVRNIDAVYAKLQKKYEVFKTKVPLYSGEPITAKIGTKEGLEGGEKFEVLEQIMDPKTGLTSYKSKGKITVDKDLIWDNQFNAGEPIPPADGKAAIDRTTFKGGKDYYSGMLIRQLK